MGKLVDFKFTGSVGGLTAYEMRGSDKIIVRQKGGPSKKRIKKDPQFENTRRNISEFGGRSTAAGWIMRMLLFQKALGDYNIAGPLNAVLKPIQVLDTTGAWGKRAVMLSKNPQLLEGFPLNNRYPFDSVLRTTLSHELSRDTLSARINIPALLPGINFHTSTQYPMFSIMVMLGVVPDLVHTELGYKPVHPGYEKIAPAMVETEWYPVLKGSPATVLELGVNAIPPDQSFSLMLSIGIRFGVMLGENTIEQAKQAGSAKILAMA